jgi:hypothetical protein
MLKPDTFNNAILLGANVEDSLLFQWFKKKGVEFRVHEEIAKRLRPQSSNLSKRLTISYFAEDRTFSKTLGKGEAIGGGTIIDVMDKLAVETFAGKPFLYIANKDRKSEIVATAPGVRMLSTVPHGLNRFQSYHNIYCSAALNREPKHYRMLADIGLASDIVHQATSGEAVYQAIMRSSLRDQGSSEMVQAIVPDRFCAEYVARRVGGAEIRQLGPVILPRKPPLSQTERSRRHQLGGRKKRMFAPQDQQNTLIGKNVDSTVQSWIPPANYPCSVTFTKCKYSNKPEEFTVKHYDNVQAFIDA